MPRDLIEFPEVEALTKQSIFDTVVRHLAEQGCQSVDDNGCAYRGHDGLKCAVGAVLLDGEYRPEMEGKMITHLAVPRLAPFVDLLSDLQAAHDESMDGASLRLSLNDTADKFGLDRAVLDGVTFPEIWR